MKLKRILTKKKEAASILEDVINVAHTPITVRDVNGQLFLGDHSDESLNKHAILCEGEIIGWVTGGAEASWIATLLSYLSAREAEKEALLDEVLNLYRQINMLYNLSENLASSLELVAVAKQILNQVSKLIKVTGSAVTLLNDQTGVHEPVVIFGRGIPKDVILKPTHSIVGEVASSGIAEIINDVRSDKRYIMGKDTIKSLICAPLMSKNRAIGSIILVSEVPVVYTAGDLNLLNTLASQATPAIENAILHEKMIREAQEREERLRKQIQELSIELNEARQREKVAEITESEYFQRLRDQADHLRDIIGTG
ncbi:MAG: GAF domain-containing protein [Anaerolineaceae bacterium]|nr:MAG: GAF domain-containing protein [Anaerolineaceae bacterium]